MAIIAPFRGLRYNPEKISRMEEVVTPPYDVIDDRAKEDFLKKNPYNMVKLDLSKSLSPAKLTAERYEQARDLFEKWQDEGVLIQDETPTIYLYYIDYLHPSGRKLTRKGLVARVQLSDFSEGVVKPHEKTFAQVTDDRLRLIDTCKAQFSKIFSIFPDRRNEVITLLEGIREEPALCSVTDQDGCVHTLWAVTVPDVLKMVQDIFVDKALYIADGHHRYTTALRFRELMRERLGALPEDSPYNYTMMYLCPMEDPGLSVLPTHRLVRIPENVSADALVEKLSAGFLAEEIKDGSRESLLGEVIGRMEEKRNQYRVFGLYHAGEDRCFLLTLKKGAKEQSAVGKLPEPLQELDVVILSDLVLEHLLGLGHDRCEKGNLVDYYSDPDAALDVAVKAANAQLGETPVLFLMNPTPVAQVKAIADQELVMPHKSTYFYPKILTGMLINKFDPEEKVR